MSKKRRPAGFVGTLQAAMDQQAAQAEFWRAAADEARLQLGLPPQPAEPAPRPEVQVKATAAHFAVRERKLGLMDAAKRMRISPRSYRKYSEKGWLLGQDEFERATGGMSLEQYFDWSGQR